MKGSLPPYVGREERRELPQLRLALYVGICEYNRDPQNLGRIKVRYGGIASADHDDGATHTSHVWSIPCVPLTGGLAVPEVGDTVIIAFDKGAEFAPIYFGTVPGFLRDITTINRKKLPKGSSIKLSGREPFHVKGQMTFDGDPPSINSATASREPIQDISAASDYPYMVPAGNEAPEESWAKRSKAIPTIRVVLKTPRGHAIYYEDDIAKEYAKIVDRMGQMIEFLCPVSTTWTNPETGEVEPLNRHNMARRGTREAIDSTQPPMGWVSGGVSKVTIIDAMQQFIQLKASATDAKIRIQGTRGDTLDPGTRGDQYGGGNYIELSQEPNQIMISCTDGGFIRVDDGVTAESDVGDVLDLHGGVALLESSDGGKVECTADVTITGTTINLESSDGGKVECTADVTITGTTINLN